MTATPHKAGGSGTGSPIVPVAALIGGIVSRQQRCEQRAERNQQDQRCAGHDTTGPQQARRDHDPRNRGLRISTSASTTMPISSTMMQYVSPTVWMIGRSALRKYGFGLTW